MNCSRHSVMNEVVHQQRDERSRAAPQRDGQQPERDGMQSSSSHNVMNAVVLQQERKGPAVHVIGRTQDLPQSTQAPTADLQI